MSKAIQFSKAVKELRIHLCQTSGASNGVREFIKKNYVDIKKVNQNTPILIRECSNVAPKVWVRYEFGAEANLPLADMNESQVLTAVEKLTK